MAVVVRLSLILLVFPECDLWCEVLKTSPRLCTFYQERCENVGEILVHVGAYEFDAVLAALCLQIAQKRVDS